MTESSPVAPPTTEPDPFRAVGDPDRLAAVRASGWLDALPEEAYDRITTLTRTLLQVPAAFLSAVDAERDVYKSHCGFGEPLATARELRGLTFCHYAIGEPELLAIADTHADPRWQAVPTVQSLGVRAYLGVPVRLRGHAIGSLCAIDHRPREWTAIERETMIQLARSIEREVQLREALARTEAEAQHSRDLVRDHECTMAYVSHDLRTPLMTLHLGLLRLQRGLPDESRAAVDGLRRSIDRMRALCDSLLAGQSSPAPARQTLSAAVLVDDAIATMEPVAARAGQTLAVRPGVSADVVGDYRSLLRALCTMLGIGVRHGRADAAIELQCTADARGVSLSVSAPDATNRDDDALDLAIVRDVAHAHGGTLIDERADAHRPRLSLVLPGRLRENVRS